MANSRSGAAMVAVGVGAGLVALGLWAMVDPQSFFKRIALFEPYNQHFLQDLGALQIGLACGPAPGRADSDTGRSHCCAGRRRDRWIAPCGLARDRNRSRWQAGHRYPGVRRPCGGAPGGRRYAVARAASLIGGPLIGRQPISRRR